MPIAFVLVMLMGQKENLQIFEWVRVQVFQGEKGICRCDGAGNLKNSLFIE